MMRLQNIFTGILTFMLMFPASASPLKSDEEIIFFPTVAYLQGDAWQVRVHGWIYEPERGGSVKQFARDLLGLEPETPEQESILRQRLHPFLADNERGKDISIRIGKRVIQLPPSSPNGHFQHSFTLAAAELAQNRRAHTLPFAALTPPQDTREFKGTVYLLENQGVSVISDIDDTIKISDVLNKQELLANTFTRPFLAVPGMSAQYQAWAAQGAQFHYVSASPWQLYPALQEFMHQAGFPPGSFHLRPFRLKDSSLFNFIGSSAQHKLEQISFLLKACPQRQFILAGDTGEKDPEIYAKIARDYPAQIKYIFLRNVTGETKDSPRYQNLFVGDNWRLFDNAAELPGDAGL